MAIGRNFGATLGKGELPQHTEILRESPEILRKKGGLGGY